VYVSAQGHWGFEDGDKGPPRGHAHMELELASVPNPAKGIIALTPRIVLFHNPGVIREFDVRGATWSGAVREGFADFNIPTAKDTVEPALRGDPDGEVAFDYPLAIDTRIFPFDGWHELRLAAIIKFADAPSHEMRAIIRLAIRLANGKTVRDWIDPSIDDRVRGVAGVGFYVPTGYARARLVRGLWGDDNIVTDEPRSLEVAFSADGCDRCVKAGHPSRAPITRSEIRIDANLHAGIPGTTIWSLDGPFSGWTRPLDFSPFEDGDHKLLLRVTQPDAMLGNTNIGQLVIPFVKA
jgi:hypothetical protein